VTFSRLRQMALRAETIRLAETHDRAALNAHEKHLEKHQRELEQFREELARFHRECGPLGG